jgi:RNA polymerase sigma-70 factor (ECF subfamily)
MPSSFPTTRWSLIGRAADSAQPGSREEMGELLEQYHRPMLIHLRYKGFGQSQAEDALQDFIITLLDKNLLSIADPQKGKFRTLLLTALDRFLVSRHRHEKAAKRSPGKLASLDAAEIDVPQEAPSAGLAFERAWALDVLAETLSRMQKECAESKDVARWRIFDERLIGPLLDGREATDYDQFAKDHSLENGKAAMNLLVTAKRQFARVLREVVGEYVTRRPAGSERADAPVTHDQHDVDFESHRIRQAIEQEVNELQKILFESRGVAELAAQLREAEHAREPLKSQYYERLSSQCARGSDSVDALFLAGTEATEDAMSVGFVEILQERLNRIPGLEQADSVTLGEFLGGKSVNAAWLQRLKDWVGLQRFSRSAATPSPLVNGLYFLTLGVATTQQLPISKLGGSQLRSGLEWLLEQPWLPAQFESVVKAALAQVEP